MGNLTFQEISDPLTQRTRVIRFWDSIRSKAFLCKPYPSEKGAMHFFAQLSSSEHKMSTQVRK